MPIMKYMIVRISQPVFDDANYSERVFVVISKHYDTTEDAYRYLLEAHTDDINDFIIMNYWAGE